MFAVRFFFTTFKWEYPSRAHRFYCNKNHEDITHSLFTCLLLTQKNLPYSILQGDFTFFVQEFFTCTKYLLYFKITGRSKSVLPLTRKYLPHTFLPNRIKIF